MLPSVVATRFVAALREGGSLPGLFEADDLGTYVVKLRGAGQGLPALVAEVVVGELGRRLGVRVPDLAVIDLDVQIAKHEADQEVQELLAASVGTNLAVDFLPGSLGYDGISRPPAPEVAARILWLDACTANVDRTWRNPNLLVWHRELWCIDHGAALWFHHDWARTSPERFAAQPYRADDHILAQVAGDLAAVDEALAAAVTPLLLAEVLALVPDDWLPAADGGPDAWRVRYVDQLAARVAAPRRWLPGVGS